MFVLAGASFMCLFSCVSGACVILFLFVFKMTRNVLSGTKNPTKSTQLAHYPLVRLANADENVVTWLKDVAMKTVMKY